jgi:hypothetical protein
VIDTLGSAFPPRSAVVAGSANNTRSDRKSPPGEQRLHQRPVAGPTGIPTRADRAQRAGRPQPPGSAGPAADPSTPSRPPGSDPAPSG